MIIETPARATLIGCLFALAPLCAQSGRENLAGPPPPTQVPPAAYFQDFSANAAGWSAVRGTWGLSGPAYASATVGDHLAVYDPGTAAGRWLTDYTFRFSVRPGVPGAAPQLGAVFDYADPNNYYALLLGGDGSAVLRRRVGGKNFDVTAPANSYFGWWQSGQVSAWIEVEIVRTGNATTVRANGARLFDAVPQSDFTAAGAVGFIDFAATSTYDNVSVQPSLVPAYQQDFASSATGWSGQGAWASSGGAYHNTASGAHDVATYGGATWLTDYTYGASVSSAGTGAGSKIGLVFNHADAGNYAEVLLDGTGTAELKKVVDGRTTSASPQPYVGRGANTWIEIVVLRKGPQTTVNVNGRRVFTDVDHAGLRAGGLGFVAMMNATAKFDDVVVTNGWDNYKRTFPRIAGIFINHQPWKDPVYQQRLARHDFVLPSIYNGWGTIAEVATALAGIKRYNPNLVISNYTNIMERRLKGDAAQPEISAKLDHETGPPGSTLQPNDWWLWNTATPAQHFWEGGYPDYGMTNHGYYVTPDAGGQRFAQWMADWEQARVMRAAGFDSIYEDNFLRSQPKQNVGPGQPDWNRDGVGDPWALAETDLPNVHYRRGLVTYLMKLTQLNPRLLTYGNVGGQTPLGGNPLATAEYRHFLHAALFEGALGQSYSVENSSWSGMMNAYRNLADQTRYPNLVVLMARGDPANGKPRNAPPANYGGGANYAFMRYGFASALMENGYFSWSGDGYDIDKATSFGWFDEFDLLLGHAEEGVQRAAWSKGVYKRKFQNGLALVNPRGNGDQTVDVPSLGNYKHFTGTQDPANDGSDITGLIQLKQGDGLILLKR